MSDEPYLTITQLRAKLPGKGGAKSICPSTVTRWILTGLPSIDGKLVKLAATRAGARWLIRQSDVDKFFAALAGEPAPLPESASLPVKPRSPAERAKSVAAASRRLAAAGA